MNIKDDIYKIVEWIKYFDKKITNLDKRVKQVEDYLEDSSKEDMEEISSMLEELGDVPSFEEFESMGESSEEDTEGSEEVLEDDDATTEASY